jgi:hypothetical protein
MRSAGGRSGCGTSMLHTLIHPLWNAPDFGVSCMSHAKRLQLRFELQFTSVQDRPRRYIHGAGLHL